MLVGLRSTMLMRQVNLKQLVAKAIHGANEYLWSLISSNILLAFC